jgi:hypothetical protein
MSLRAVVSYEGSLAHYAVTPDNFGIYYARLLKYEGTGGATPPECFILVRSERRWISACEDERFVNALGRAIEQRTRNGDPHDVG